MSDETTPPIDSRLLLEHEAWVRRLARRLVRCEDDADELVQEAFLSAWRTPPRRAGDLRPWFAVVTRNAARQRRRREKTRRRHTEAAALEASTLSGVPADESLARLEVQRRVTEAVLALRAPERRVVVLRYYEELTPTEIARRLGVPLTTVKSQLAGAREKLARRLASSWPGGGPACRGALLATAGLSTGDARGAHAASLPGLRAGPGTVRFPRLAAVRWGLASTAAVVTVAAVATSLATDAPRGPLPVVDRTARPPDAALPVGPGRASRLAAASVSAPDVPPGSSGAADVPQPSPSDPDDEVAPAAPADHLLVVVTFEGEVPPPREVPTTLDCGGGVARERAERSVLRELRDVVVDDGRLADVFVGLEPAEPHADAPPLAPGDPVLLAFRECDFSERVLAVPVGGTVRFANEDSTLHNVHVYAEVNRQLNYALPTASVPLDRSFSHPEDAVRIACDVHANLAPAWLFVSARPAFGVTDELGRVDLVTAGLPSGQYRLTAWHPTLGLVEEEVWVGAGEAEHVLTFRAPEGDPPR